MLRQERAAQTALGQHAEKYMSQGELAPDPLILEMVGKRIEQPDCRRGMLFDGFPRTVHQAEALDRSLAELGQSLDAVLELKVDDQELIRRLSSRGRQDDLPRIISQRLKLYWRQTTPLLEYYRERGLVCEIDGVGSQDEVFARILAALESKTPGGKTDPGATKSC